MCRIFFTYQIKKKKKKKKKKKIFFLKIFKSFFKKKKKKKKKQKKIETKKIFVYTNNFLIRKCLFLGTCHVTRHIHYTIK